VLNRDKAHAVLPALLVIGLMSLAHGAAGHHVAARRPSPALSIAKGPVFCEPSNIDDPDGGRWFPDPPGCPAGWHQA
jgi:hypothetical protein